jgi:hypothetical protein
MRGQWFVLDEFDYLAPPKGDSYLLWLIRPHNEHTIVFTKLWFSMLFHTIGLRAYLLYGTPMVLSHGVAALASYGVLRRSGVSRLLSWSTSLAILCMGAAVGTLTWGGQFQYTGSVAAGIIAIWIVLGLPTRRSLVLLWVVSLFGTFNGDAFLPFAVAAGLAFLYQRRYARAAVVAIPSIAWFGLSRVLFRIPSGYAAHSVTQLLLGAGNLAFAIFSRAITDTIKVPGLSGAILIVLAIGVVFVLLRPMETPGGIRARNALLLLGLAFAVLLAEIVIGRLSRPVADSANGGYSYLVLIIIFPIVGLLASMLGRQRLPLTVLAAVSLAVLAAVGLANIDVTGGGLASWKAQGRIALEQAAGHAHSGATAYPTSIPAPAQAPTVTWSDLRQWADHGKIPLLKATESESATNALLTQFRLTPSPASALASDYSSCTALRTGDKIALAPRDSVLVVGKKLQTTGITLRLGSSSPARQVVGTSKIEALTSIASTTAHISSGSTGLRVCSR